MCGDIYEQSSCFIMARLLLKVASIDFATSPFIHSFPLFLFQGPKAFQRHFAEWRHAHGMRCLGIPNTAHFANVTQIEDAMALWEKLKGQKSEEAWKPEQGREEKTKRRSLEERFLVPSIKVVVLSVRTFFLSCVAALPTSRPFRSAQGLKLFKRMFLLSTFSKR